MIKVIIATMAVFAVMSISNVSTYASETARQKCCVEMGGRYVPAPGGNKVCTGLGRASADTYYKCVESGGKSAKH